MKTLHNKDHSHPSSLNHQHFGIQMHSAIYQTTHSHTISTNQNIIFFNRTKDLVGIYKVFMFLIIQCYTQVAWSQVSDPCRNCLSFTLVGARGTSTDISSILPIQDCSLIRGQLVINRKTTWSNLRIAMDDGAEIFVKDTLTITGSNLAACDTLWRGIRTNGINSGLFVSTTAISGAEFAMRLNAFTSFSCQYNTFNNNYIGVAVGSPFETDGSEIILYQRGLIQGNTFYTSSNLPIPYNGHFYSPNWPTIPAEIPYNQGYTAFYLSGTLGFNIGFPGATGADRNRIYNMRNGIIGRFAVMSVEGTNFFDFEGSVPTIQGLDPRQDINQVGIDLFLSYATITKDSFLNVFRGVKSIDTYQSISNCVMNIRNSPLLSESRGIQARNAFGLSILSNKIKHGWKGIEIDNIFVPFQVKNNELMRNIGGKLSVGIDMLFAKLPTIGSGVVQGNTITTEVGHLGTIGIGLTECHGLYIKDNDISFPISLYAGASNAGISGITLTNSLIVYNDITGASAYESIENNSGIVLTNSRDNYLFCNEMDDMYRGMWLVAGNDLTRVEVNTFEQATIGFEIFGPAAIGEQDHTGNVWFGNYTGGAGGQITGADPINTATQCKFNIDTLDASPCVLKPCPILPGSIVGDEWFEQDTGLAKECIAIDDPDDPIADTLADLLLTELDFEVYIDELLWVRKAGIFEAILKDPALLSHPVLDSFYNAEANTALGKLVWCEHQMSIKHGSNPSTLKEAIDSVAYFQEEVTTLDSVINLNPLNVNAMIALRTLKCDSLSYWLDDLLDQLEDEQTITFDSIEAAIDTVQLLTTTTDLESNLKDILILAEPRWRGDTLTSTAVGSLPYFATQCPWLGGRSLGWGQMLYSQELDSLLSAVPFECPGDDFVIADDEEDAKKAQRRKQSELSFWPNPAATQVNIYAPSGSQWLEIFDAMGNLKLRQSFNGSRLSLDVKDLPSGMYIIVLRNEKEIMSQILCIQR